MASSLDLQEQEQVDALKAYWKQYGNLITWGLIAVLAAFAAWNGWNWYQRDQGLKAGAMFDELERAAVAGDSDRTARVFTDLKQRYPGTAYAEQGGLLSYQQVIEDFKSIWSRHLKLIWEGTSPGDIPVERPTQFELAVNVSTAKAWGLAIDKSVLKRADKIY